MFTGLIREIATVKSFSGSELSIRSKHKAKLGDSIAINGACLSVVKLSNDGFSVELSPESQKHLALENYKNEVHIEPAMMMGDRFEGHIVQGHIDAIVTIKEIRNSGNSFDVFISVDKKFIPYIVPKGSITKDGPSAGITIAVALLSALTNVPVINKVGFTGEITLSGRVLPIVGVKEKVLAAKRAGIETVVIPDGNKNDISELPKSVRKSINIITASHVTQVFKVAFRVDFYENKVR